MNPASLQCRRTIADMLVCSSAVISPLATHEGRRRLLKILAFKGYINCIVKGEWSLKSTSGIHHRVFMLL